MSIIGENIKLHRSGSVKVLSFLDSGGEAHLYKVEHIKSGEIGVLKIFQDHEKRTERNQRTKFLIDQDLGSMGSVFTPPIDWINDSKIFGHYTPFIDGCTLESYLGDTSANYYENLKMAVTLAYGIAGLHKLDIAHGDIQIRNIMVRESSNHSYQPSWIDFDNFNAPEVKGPYCFGQEFYMAPEQRAKWESDSFQAPDRLSDIFSLAAILHELILCKILASGQEEVKASFDKAMASGIWFNDPARNVGNSEGRPSQMLNQDLCRLFRKSVSLHPDERPQALEWAQTLEKSIHEIFIHDKCSEPVFIDSNQRICPYCKTPYSTLKLVFQNPKNEVPITSAGIPIGRSQLKSEKVSRNHALLKKVGPETRLESFGANGTYTQTKNGWIRLRDRKVIPISKGQTLRFGDVECRVEEM